MTRIAHSFLLAVLAMSPAAAWAMNSNPDATTGGHKPAGMPTHPSTTLAHSALAIGNRYSVTPGTPAYRNPTVPGATGITIVPGDRSTISSNWEATILQRTSGTAADASG